MHRAAYITALILAGSILAPTAQAADPFKIAAALYPSSPCAGRITVAFDPAVGARGRSEEASINNPALYPVVCVITFDPHHESEMTPMNRCATFVHGAGHLAGLNHTPTGIMSENGANEYYEPCASIRERVMHRLERPGIEYVTCGKWTGSLMRCRAGKDGNVARYRVRSHGDTYTMKRYR